MTWTKLVKGWRVGFLLGPGLGRVWFGPWILNLRVKGGQSV